MRQAVAVFQDIGAEDMLRSELVLTVGFVDRTIETRVVLKRGIDIPVPADHPPVMEPVVINRMVVAQTLVQRKRIVLEDGLIELAGVDRSSQKLFHRRH